MKLGIIFIIMALCVIAGPRGYGQAVQPQLPAQPVTAAVVSSAPEPVPVLEIKASEKDPSLFSIELKDAGINDIFRVLAHDYDLNILVDGTVSGTVTASFTSIALEEALEILADINNLRLEKKGRVIVVKPNLITKTFVLNYINVEDLLGQKGSAGTASASTAATAAGTTGPGAAVAAAPAVSAVPMTGTASQNTIYDLLSGDGKILNGSQTNSLVVIDYPPYVEKISAYIDSVDKKMSTKVFNLQYISVKDLFSDLIDRERSEREKQREERKAERDEIKEIREKSDEGGSGG